MRQQLIAFYLEWANDFLNIDRMNKSEVERFAEYHSITMKDANDLINMGRFYLHEELMEAVA
tara:strand:- start:64 stop:249 length:186 start_codon:yes stop_codon:yes gene_type:complete